MGPSRVGREPLRANVWDGARSPLLRDVGRARAADLPGVESVLAPAVLPSERDWRHPSVGWGLVLLENDKVSSADKAMAADAPAAIRRLREARNDAPVLRYDPAKGAGSLTRHYANGGSDLLDIGAPRYGTGYKRIPQYLLIYGSPDAIPWALQYNLNLRYFVGRLDLAPDEGLQHYVDALIDDWRQATGNPLRPFVWCADHGAPDITWLMARAIGDELIQRFQGDEELQGAICLRGEAASAASLAQTLAERKPGLICATSHGAAVLPDGPAALKGSLGLPVDTDGQAAALDALTGAAPAGAIWYAQSCFSAGSDAQSRYAPLLGEDAELGPLLTGVAATCGARVAPLPRGLLGRPEPLRAFIGHVEPTFDYALRNPLTRQLLAPTIAHCLHERLYQAGEAAPLGWALFPLFAEAGGYLGQSEPPPQGADVQTRETLALYRRLAGLDRQSLVILGDPAVALRTAP